MEVEEEGEELTSGRDPEDAIKACSLLKDTLGWRYIEAALRLYRDHDLASILLPTTDESTTNFLRGRISAIELMLDSPERIIGQARAQLDNALESHKSIRERMRVERGL